MEAHPVAAHRLQEREGTHQIGADEGGGVAQGVVIMRLGGEVDDDVGGRHERVHGVGLGDVPDDQVDPIAQIRQ